MRLASSKYNAKRTEWNGRVFASKAEARRAQELELMERAGAICNLTYQQRYPLIVNAHRVCVYVSDFEYDVMATGEHMTEDTKGVRTPAYRIKRALMKALYGIEILETGTASPPAAVRGGSR